MIHNHLSRAVVWKQKKKWYQVFDAGKLYCAGIAQLQSDQKQFFFCYALKWLEQLTRNSFKFLKRKGMNRFQLTEFEERFYFVCTAQFFSKYCFRKQKYQWMQNIVSALDRMCQLGFGARKREIERNWQPLSIFRKHRWHEYAILLSLISRIN